MTEIYAPPGNEQAPDNGDIEMRPGHRPFSIQQTNERLKLNHTFDRDRKMQQLIFDEAINIACDWLEATGGEPIEEEVFKNLYQNGYASYTNAVILEIFYDWKDFQSVAQTYYEEREDIAQTDKALVQNLQQEAAVGLVPSEFFKKAEAYKIDNPNGKKKLLRYRLTDESASDKDILQRYYKYLVADFVTRERDSDKEITEERKINIALGFSVATEKPLSSFFAALKNSNSSLDEEQLMLAIDELGAYDYIHPESRQHHLKQFLEAGKPMPPSEYYYDLKTNKILVLGRTALSQFTESQNYIVWLKEQKLLRLIGNEFDVRDNKKLEDQKIQSLAMLLTNENIAIEGHGENRNKHRPWPKELYIEYGRWLMNLADLDASIITRAHRLGLGPGVEAFSSQKRFGSLTQFFSELGFTNRTPKGKMDSMSSDAIIGHVKKVAELNSGKVTVKLLRDYYQSQAIKDAPSIYMLSKLTKGRLSELVEAAGFRVHNKKYGAEGCLDMVKDFIKNEGRIPNAKDFDKNPGLPSRPTIYRYFGDLDGLKAILSQEIVLT